MGSTSKLLTFFSENRLAHTLAMRQSSLRIGVFCLFILLDNKLQNFSLAISCNLGEVDARCVA